MADAETGAEEDEWWFEHCAVIPPETLRVVLVGGIGTALATTSFFFNLFLFVVLAKSRQHKRSHLLYLMLLALIDFFLSASYILLFPVNIFMDLFESTLLSTAWWSYLRPMLALCHVAITASALLITAATFERFLTISKIRSQFSTPRRLAISAVVLFFALAAKGPMFFEMNIVNNENCTGVTAYVPEMTEWSTDEPYKTAYKFWFRTIVSVFLPFFFSLHFNIRIIQRLRHQQSGARLFRCATSEHRKHIRSATIMLVSITCTYLGCNLLNVFVAAWEFIDQKSLLTPEIRPFYTYSSDLISLLTIAASTSRLPIYYACNARIRREVHDVLVQLCICSDSKEFKLSRENLTTMRFINSPDAYVVHRKRTKLHQRHQQRLKRQQEEQEEQERKKEPRQPSVGDVNVSFGTSVDKLVLTVAMQGLGRSGSIVPSRDTMMYVAEETTDSETSSHEQ